MYAINFHENDRTGAQLIFDGDILKQWTPLLPTVIDITPHFAPERKKVESFIAGVYRKSYNADIRVTYPMLMSVRNKDGEILAAAGFRSAALEPLFLEQYTRKPIEQVLSGLHGSDIPRAEIAEIGNLASEGKGASVFLFGAIASYLLKQGIHHATATGTRQLHRRFNIMGMNPHTVCEANIESLEKEQNSWGSYYDTQPRVLTGSLEDGMQRLNETLGAVYCENGQTLFPRLHPRAKA